MFKRKTVGLAAVAAGMISVAACAAKLRADTAPEGVFDDYYTYKPPLSAHELVMASLSLMSLFLLAGGLVLSAADGVGAEK